jgi:hypothetical protein
VAKLLFLSMNTRPDIALPVNYLCTRVERFDDDDDDFKKFYRILQYLHETTKLGMTLSCNETFRTIHVYTTQHMGSDPYIAGLKPASVLPWDQPHLW